MSKRQRSARSGAALLLVGVLVGACADTQPVAPTPEASPAEQPSLSTSDEYYISIPTTCPTNILGGAIGALFGYEYQGYRFVTDWRRTAVLTPNYDVADYVATAGPNVVSRDGGAVWYSAGLRFRCTARHHYFLGHLIASTEVYEPIHHFGEVRQLPPDIACGGQEPIYMYGYDPYDPGEVSADCSGGGGEGGVGDGGGGGDSGGGDSGWGSGSFASMCSDLGGKLYYDTACLELWNDAKGDYETVWCGTAAFCET